MAQNSSDFPPGPLDRYRKLASFNWKRLKVVLYGQEFVDFEERLTNELKKYPEYYEYEVETPTLDETRRKTVRKMFATKSIDIFEEANSNSKKKAVFRIMYTLDPSMSIMVGLCFQMFRNAIEYMGTERHKDIFEKSIRGEIFGGFGLTEIGHGSNTRGMRTTATYDTKTKRFILHSPDFEAAKCWGGVLGLVSTHAVVFAHLITDGVKRGLHAFLVPIRDPYTLLTYIGVNIIDMGEKIGLNGIDNGVVMFDNYSIPRESLLNKFSDVAEDGSYTTPYNDVNKLHGALFGTLSDGRITICLQNVIFLTKALTIAIRYAAVRKQFSIGNGEEEIPILEYQTHQYRLMPYLAAVYCYDVLCNYLYDYKAPVNDGTGSISEVSAELHAISSAAKPASGWVAREGIQECREACAGHGYLKAAGLGTARSDQDACTTYEGANHVLLQQTSSWLLKQWSLVLKGKHIKSPFKTIDFLNNVGALSTSKFSANSVDELMEPNTILKAYQWLVYYLLKRYHEKLQLNLKSGQNIIEAKNNSQVFVANDLAIAYIEHFTLLKMEEKIMETNDYQIKKVLTRLMSLFGLWSLQKHVTTLFIGSYITGPLFGNLLQEAVLRLCSELKDDSVALIDAIAPADFILHSVLGNSDGQVYKHLEAVMKQAPGALSRPEWWKEIVYWKSHVKPKL